MLKQILINVLIVLCATGSLHKMDRIVAEARVMDSATDESKLVEEAPDEELWQQHAMLNRTVLNTVYKGLVESLAIPAKVQERDGKKFATVGSVVPIHCCTPEEVAERSKRTHYYCDIFTNQIFAPLGEEAYVRLDENTAEKVFINRSKRLLLLSSDGRLAQWRFAPTFESSNQYIAGAPLVNKDGNLVSVVTAKQGKLYAISSFEGDGGYFETTQPWKILDIRDGDMVYGDHIFTDLEELKQFIDQLPPVEVGARYPTTPVFLRGRHSRLALVAQNGRQLAHHYLQGVVTSDIDYL